MKQKVLLMILDGWGIGNRSKGDVISTVHPAYISAMTEKYPHAQLHTDGENVGLPDGQMGNSEVGHLNIGAGRVVYQDLVKINRACKDGSIMENAEVKAAFEYAKAKGVNVHFMGLVSDGGVHSSIDHLYKLCDIAIPMYTASWTAAIPTRTAARVSLRRWSAIRRSRRASSRRSSAVTMRWIATSAGSV